MEIFHLRYFVAVAENLSFSRAARGLHMATSPLSRRVRDLEDELGTALFERDSHSVRLTDAGSALLPIAKDVLGRFDDIPWRLREKSSSRQLTVYIGIPPGLHSRMREKLKELERAVAPDYEIKRWPGGTGELLNAVQRGELGLALVRLPVHAEGVDVLEVMREPLGAVVPSAEFAGRESVSLTELLDHTYVLPAPGMVPTYFEQLKVRLAAAGIRKTITLNSGDYAATTEIISNGSAFSISMLDPGSSMQRYRTEATTVLPFADFDPALATGLIWRRDRAGSDLAALVERAREILPEPA
ncbi:LysR family transcriptional regulator [Saccharopolyspora taberi]|uniref:LysR family transcriptional regulator n=1 Tax=Saccharopolyspora taberi TaxID=60895 RepID=A0ABN3V1R3_9PSEU